MKTKPFIIFLLAVALCLYGCTTEYIYVTSDDDAATPSDGTDPDNSDNGSGGFSENDGTYDDDFFSEPGDGTPENPYTASQALEVIGNGSYDSDNAYYVKGIVSYKNGGGGYSDGTCLINYYISNDGIYSGLQGKDLLIYYGYYFGWAHFPSSSYLHIEDKVIVCGRFSTGTYREGTPTVNNGVLCYLNGEYVDDVCEYMTDSSFKKYCLSNFDTDGDGKVSLGEANTVTKIDCSTAEDFSGILYFSNLESFTSYSARHLDLSKNAELSYIRVGNYDPYNPDSSTESAPIETLDLSNNINLTALGSYAFSQCYKLASVTLPETMTTIGFSAFFYCTRLRSISWPENLISIDIQAFCGCNCLESVTLPEGLTSIGLYAFYGCERLTSITIPDSVTSLGEYGVFIHCSGLQSVTLPAELTVIGERGFYDCTSLSSVTIKATTPPSLGDEAFYKIDSSAVLYVPSESIDAYTNSDWAQWFSQILPIE